MPIKKRQIMFVDDEAFILKGYKRALEQFGSEWDVYYCTSGMQALTTMNQQPIDVLITDMRMPGMDGIALLEQVIQNHPSVVRIIMSGNVEEPAIYKAANIAHQLIAKPCDIEKMRNIIEETCQLRDLLSDRKLIKLVTGIKNLPSVPTLYIDLINEFQTDQPAINKVGEIISMDVAMTAKILQLVNSAFFSIPHKVSNLNQALSILGLNTIKALVLSVGIFSKYQDKSFNSFSIEELWQHSIFVGNLSRAIASSASLNRFDQDDAQMAGILHDVGKLIQTNIPGFFRLLSMNTKVPELQIEYHYLGTSHAEIGAYMLSLWGLPTGVIKAVAFHHNPAKDTAFKIDPVTAVHIANHLYYTEKPFRKENHFAPPLNKQYLEQIGVDQQLEDWRLMAQRIYAGEQPD